MSNENNLVLPEQYAHRVTPFFASQEDFIKIAMNSILKSSLNLKN